MSVYSDAAIKSGRVMWEFPMEELFPDLCGDDIVMRHADKKSVSIEEVGFIEDFIYGERVSGFEGDVPDEYELNCEQLKLINFEPLLEMQNSHMRVTSSFKIASKLMKKGFNVMLLMANGAAVCL